MEVIEGTMCEYLWGNSKVAWCCKPSNDLSGGLLTMSDKSKFELPNWYEARKSPVKSNNQFLYAQEKFKSINSMINKKAQLILETLLYY
ncbi:hypothetical protein VNO78_23360 [Psophocarpus tetragonolobus]|uniref:Uncharacterized protein n=1 Tax=Psophocarpus tetragonolobus TaxID=3891 RepID=A0AAN9S4R9_PSOTE